jgi:hypothetical protein
MSRTRRTSEDVAVLAPDGEPVALRGMQTGGRDAIAAFTLEEAYQSVPALPALLSEADVIRIAKEERAERFARKLRAP